MSSLGRAALGYAKRLGWPVFPLAFRGKAPAVPKDRGGRGVLDATTDSATIVHWWRAMAEANVGVAMGEQAGVWCLDVDPRHDGDESLLELVREHGPLPETVEQLTGGGGRHLLFSFDKRVRNRPGFRPGLDAKTTGGYIVAAPSIHPNGRPYAWEVDHHPLDVWPEPAPEWLVALVAAPEPAPEVQHLADRLAELCAPVPEGRRNATAASLTGYLLRRWVDPQLALALVAAWNRCHCTPPLDEGEITRTVDSIACRELRRRKERAA
ncbi:MAG: bifunctional DNA primase/polymerase [Rhodospirillales bacterium]|nr:bifunctional DNA primase/polymerase [Rhodospirillales bacterium]